MLIEKGKGREQKRQYIDVIAYYNDNTILHENKPNCDKNGIQRDIDKLNKYKTEKAYIDSVCDFNSKFNPTTTSSIIKIGVGFIANQKLDTQFDLQELDYFVYITSDKKRWKVWETGSETIFSINQGDVMLPQIYSIDSG